jgi:transcription termination factor Rho
MAVLNRTTLTESPLSDLHELAAEFGLEGFRKLRKSDLIGAILESQGIEDEGPPPEAPEAEPEPRQTRERGGSARRPRGGGGGGASRGRSREERGSRRGRGPGGDDDGPRDAPREEQVVEGTVELLGNGSGFLRLAPPEPGDDDVYISAAQVRRCELVAGDKVAGPVRPPRRSERFPSLIRVDTINGKPADEVAEGTRFDDLPVAYPAERIKLTTTDKGLKEADAAAPIGKGTRMTIAGAPHAGKSELLRAYAAAFAKVDGLETTVVLVGIRPEELGDWTDAPAYALTYAATPEAQSQAVFAAIDTARRIAARGGDAAVLIDTLDGLSAGAARRALGAARNIADGGSLTVIVAATAPIGIETTIVTLDVASARAGKSALDPGGSGTIAKEALSAKPAASRAKPAATRAKPAAAKKPAVKKPAAAKKPTAKKPAPKKD